MPGPASLDAPRPPEPTELVTLGAIAQVLHVQRGTVDVWRHRGRAGHAFPDPDDWLGRRPLWRWATVASWCELVGAS